MFKEIGQLASMMRSLPKIREEVGQLQERLTKIVVEGDAGAGMVKTRVNGKLELIGCTISEDSETQRPGNARRFNQERGQPGHSEGPRPRRGGNGQDGLEPRLAGGHEPAWPVLSGRTLSRKRRKIPGSVRSWLRNRWGRLPVWFKNSPGYPVSWQDSGAL